MSDESPSPASSTPARPLAVWFDLPVHDLDRAMRFYSYVLALPMVRENSGGRTFAVLSCPGGAGGCLIPIPASQPIPAAGPLLYLSVEGRLRAALTEVIRLGGRIEMDVFRLGAHGWCAVVHDCEGNRIALHATQDR
jgi:uncharacterized protein